MPPKKKPESKRSRRKESTPAVPAFDRRSMEKMMADIGKLLEEHDFESIEEANEFLQQIVASGMPEMPLPETPLEMAQELMHEAWGAIGPQRAELARQALLLSPDCADAYVLLAEEVAETPAEAVALYAEGVRAGERALEPEIFEEGEGHFWGIIETRPYMRAREGLAALLWLMGRRDEALMHYREMLRLNPNDNQGIRYLLANCLLETGADSELASLLEQYEEEATAVWVYTRALLAFRQKGDSPEATARLREAIQQNPHVPPYLLGKKRLPKNLPEYMGFGDKNEAIHYVVQAKETWTAQEGAIEWLQQTVT
jgi:tetratricopeptide (TPR) repeat protein